MSPVLGRWLRFNFVGLLGIGIQLGALAIFKGWLHLDYLTATALAVETAVLHNFVWHERFTFKGQASGVGALLGRLLRFHIGNGLISIGGNLALMRVLTGWLHVYYLAANLISIAICSVINFLVSDRFVFRSR